MYKWYNEEGKVNYSQAPPPKGSRPANINTEIFNAIKMRKAPAISSTYRKQVSHKRKKQYERWPGTAAHADNFEVFLRH
ncbi:MAG: DUF4124 domain-containing protein [Candidatus Thiodiazotropha sp. (ex Lucinoma aequizonata)]|nr:DUF4124 domain-containing protein [Candidatus Thiodiazotropha sp. (ex Lucinoma aequizonata)]MCU7889826.1 DUF4124 domain-containing protein [Candidatus Thiodiazotropha sp. (ex Lucinoma aequizonata)]MCU7899591.1 DUF4124 domain-containing protein [Candidatus Thiodiazotropha sp. (ex Lucinoma aequizonata)]MCU7909838.1 DUF4124 domain-containing protein [Candidatus Thiodiazotropha sp. (ex Lucinoma aequizonata)]